MKSNIYDTNFLYFDEGPHKYTDTLGNEYTSVTTLIHDNYVPKFDKKYWLHKKARERGITEKALEREWQAITDEACTRGTAIHNGIEDAIKDVSMFKNAIKYLEQGGSGRCITVADIPKLIPTPLNIDEFKKATNEKYPEIYRVFDFYTQRGYTIYSEIGVFLPSHLISGTIDILCVCPTNFVILDWKTNRDGLQFESGYYKKDKTTIPPQRTNEWVRKDERMLAPLNHLPDCNGSHYTMQLSLYARMTELILGIPCVGMGLCHIACPFVKNAYGMPYRDENNQYPLDPNGEEVATWHRIPYKRHEANLVLADRLAYLNSKKVQINNQLDLFNNYETT